MGEVSEYVGGILDLGSIIYLVGKKCETDAKPRETDEKPLKSMLSVFLSEK